jgi:hypothetical protein
VGYEACKCHTLLMPSGTYHDPDRKHLFIVCTDCCAAGKHLIVSITGWTNDLCDGTTRLSPGPKMHRFVTKESYIFYRKARVEDSAVLSKGVDEGIFVPHDPVDESLLARVMAGVCSSKQTPRKVKIYANCKLD